MNLVKLLLIKRVIIKGLSKPMVFLLWLFLALVMLANVLDKILN